MYIMGKLTNIASNIKDNLNEFSDKFYDTNSKKFNRDLIVFVVISMSIIYFILNLLDGMLKIPIILILGIICGLYIYKRYKK